MRLLLAFLALILGFASAGQRLSSPTPVAPFASHVQPCGNDVVDPFPWAQWVLGSRVRITWVSENEPIALPITVRFAFWDERGAPPSSQDNFTIAVDADPDPAPTPGPETTSYRTLTVLLPPTLQEGLWVMQAQSSNLWTGCSVLSLIPSSAQPPFVRRDPQIPRSTLFPDSNPIEKHFTTVVGSKGAILTTWQNGYSPYFRYLDCGNPYSAECSWSEQRTYLPDYLQISQAVSCNREVVVFRGDYAQDYPTDKRSWLFWYNTTTNAFIYNTTAETNGTMFTLLFPHLNEIYAYQSVMDAVPPEQRLWRYDCSGVGRQIGILSEYRTATPVVVLDRLVFGPDVYSTNPNSKVDVYHIPEDKLTDTEMSSPRVYASTVGCKKYAFIAGGGTIQDDMLVPVTTIDILDVEQGVWLTPGTLTEARGLITGYCFNGWAVFAGGATGNVFDFTPSAMIDFWWDDNSATGFWGSNLLSQPRYAIGALGFGSLIVMGGGVGASGNYSAAVDVLDTLSEAWSVHQLAQPRAFLPVIASQDVHTVRELTMFFMGGFDQYIRSRDGLEYSRQANRIDMFDRATLHNRVTALSDNETYTYLEDQISYSQDQFQLVFGTELQINDTVAQLQAALATLQADYQAFKTSVKKQCLNAAMLGASDGCSGDDGSKPNNTGAIVGGIIGGLIGVALGVGAVAFYNKRREAKKRADDLEVRLLPIQTHDTAL